jgi:recombination protein RecT
MQNQLMAKQNTFMVVRDLLEKSKNEIAKALPKSITSERVARIALTTLRKNPGLLECDPNSFLGAVMQASQLGFEIDDNLGYVYLVPFFNKKTGKKEVQLLVGYRGLIELARRSGKLRSVSARLVYENEPFSIEYGLMETLRHTPLPPSKRGEKVKGVYAVASMSDNTKVFDFLWSEEIEEVKKSSKAGDSKTSPWATHEEEMMKKTVIRRMMKYLSLSPEITKATVIDEYGESGINTKDMFITSETGNKTLGMTEPKALTNDKITHISDYRTEELPTKNGDGDSQITTAGPVKTEAEAEPSDTFTSDNSDYDNIPWDYEETSAMQTTEPKAAPAAAQNSSYKKDDNIEYVTDKQLSYIESLCKQKSIYEEQIPELTESVFGEPINLIELTKKQAKILIDYLKSVI